MRVFKCKWYWALSGQELIQYILHPLRPKWFHSIVMPCDATAYNLPCSCQGAGPLRGILSHLADAKKEMLPYHQAVSMLKYVIDKAPACPCLVDEWTRLTAIDFYSIYKFLAMTFTSRFIVGEYGCLGTVQLRKPVSCISMADDFPFAHPGAVGIGLVLFDADVIVGV